MPPAAADNVRAAAVHLRRRLRRAVLMALYDAARGAPSCAVYLPDAFRDALRWFAPSDAVDWAAECEAAAAHLVAEGGVQRRGRRHAVLTLAGAVQAERDALAPADP